MKKCQQCGGTYSDDMTYCSVCGKTLRNSVSRTRIAVLISAAVSLTLIVLIALGGSALKKQQKAIDDSNRQKRINEVLNTPTTSDVVIHSDYNIRQSGDYVYIDGTIENVSEKNVRYYEIGIRFYDRNGTIVDTDMTNGSNLGVGEMQTFSTMHRDSHNWSKVDLYIREVS